MVSPLLADHLIPSSSRSEAYCSGDCLGEKWEPSCVDSRERSADFKVISLINSLGSCLACSRTFNVRSTSFVLISALFSSFIVPPVFSYLTVSAYLFVLSVPVGASHKPPQVQLNPAPPHFLDIKDSGYHCTQAHLDHVK